MRERGCIKCGYILTGLPAAGTTVSCPECGLANDLASPLPVGEWSFAPILWALLPAALAPVLLKLCTLASIPVDEHAVKIIAVGVLGGAITGGVLEYRMIWRKPGIAYAPRPRSKRLSQAVLVVIGSVFFNMLAAVGMIALLFRIVP